MASLRDDVLKIICDDLHDLHTSMMDQVDELSPSELVARTIMGTANAIENRYTLASIGACESNGDPHYSTGIGLHYWGEVCEMDRTKTLEREATTHPRDPAITE